MTSLTISRRTEYRWLLIILLLGSWLRFHQLADTDFNVDQMYPVWQALMTLQQGEFPLIGQGTSVLFANPTLTGYLFAPFLIIGPNPLTPLVVVVILNSFGMWFAYRAVRRLLGPVIALIATTLFAVNPWIIEYSRQTWVQSLMVFFVTLIFWLLVPILMRQTAHPQRQLLKVAAACALFANTYLLSYLIVAPVGVLGVLFWPRIPKQALAMGIVIFALMFGLYAYGLGREWEVTQDRAETFLNEGESRLSDESLGHAVRLVTGWEYAAARGNNAPTDDAAQRADISEGVHWLWFIALLVGLGQALWAIIRKTPHREGAIILLVWFVVPIVAMSYVSRVVHPFYVLFTVPAGHALAAWGVVPLLSPRIGVRVVLFFLAFTALINGFNSIRFYQDSHANAGEHRPYTFTVETALNMGRRIDKAHEADMIIYTPMDVWAPMTFMGDIFPVVRATNFHRQLIIPPSGGLYMTFSGPDESLQPPIHGQVVDVPLYMRDGTRFVLWRAEQNLTPRNPADIPSDIGVRFIGWHLLQPLQAGHTAQLRTYWRVDSLPPERFGWIFVPYIHVFDGADNRILIADGEPLPLTTWQEGDWLVQEMSISLPADSTGPYGLNVGIVDGGRMVNAIFNYLHNDEMIFTADLTLLE